MWLIEWCFTLLSTVFQSYHIIHVFPGFHQYYAGLWNVLLKDTPTKKTQRIQCGSNPGPVDYESNTLPLSHVGPRKQCGKRRKCWLPALYPFPTMFSKALHFRVVKSPNEPITRWQILDFQTERVCRPQFQLWQKWQKVIQMDRKRCGKRRNCSLRAISPFPTVFSKGLFPRGV